MKTKLCLFMTILIGVVSFSQNWHQVGTAQFTNFASNAAMAIHPTTGYPYIIYNDVLDGNKPYVVQYNGTSWASVGSGAIISNEVSLINIAFNPGNGEANVAFKNKTTNSIDVYKFDGTNWVAIKTNLPGSGGVREVAPLSIQYDLDNNIYIFGYENKSNNTTNHLLKRFFDAGTVYNWGSSTWSSNEVYTVRDIPAYPTGYDKYLLSSAMLHSAYAQSSYIYHYEYKSNSYGGNAGTLYYNTRVAPGRFSSITSVPGGDYWAGQNEALGSQTTKKIIFGNKTTITAQPLGTEDNTNDIMTLSLDVTKSKIYLMYSDSDEKLQFQEYNSNSDIWSNLPDLDISTSGSTFFSDIKFNSLDNKLYMMYSDGGKISVKNYEPAPSLPRYYVNSNVSGGDGSGDSWTNAMTDLSDALNNADISTTEIWVAEGNYKPGDNRNKSFTLGLDNLSIYGGFNGTENSISERDLVNNSTILSGDLDENDTEVNFTSTTRSDNSYNVINITANYITLDGFKINDGHANGTSENAYGGGLKISDDVTSLKISNCEFNNNVGYTGGAIRVYYNTNSILDIENCIFNKNLSRYGSGLYFLANNNRSLNLNITNSLFVNNISQDLNSTDKGYTGSAAWIRANGTNSTITTTITNSTFANNTDIGTQPNCERGSLALGKRTDAGSTHNATINNSIFYNNKGVSESTTFDVNGGHTAYPNVTLVNNSIGEDNFSTLTFLTNTSNLDPLFTDAENNNFTLQVGSPAIDTGDNSKIPTSITTDLVGNNRIYNTTVDMGVYEKGALINVTLTTNATHGSISEDIAPTNGSYTEGTVVELTATPDTGYQFDGWIGDASGTDNPLSVIMNTNKNITATFILIPCNINIPDPNFKAALVADTYINTDGDTEISCDEAIAYTGILNAQNKGITDVTGLEAFVNATGVWLNGNAISNIDLSNNLSIAKLSLSGNSITSLDLSNHVLLQNINISYNKLTSLNAAIGSNSNSVYWNHFDIQGNPDLTCVTVSNLTWSNNNWIQKDSQTSYSLACSTLGVEDHEFKNSINVYPNPVNDWLNIKTDVALENISLYTIEGKKILTTNEKELNVAGLAAGLYILKLESTSGKTVIKRFIKD